MNKNIWWSMLMVLVLVGTVVSAPSAAEDLSGKEIMRRVYERDEGEDREAELKMILINKFGDKRERELKQFNRDFGEVEKKIMFFTAPSDIRNTSFMNWTYEDEREDDQWIYLPALRKIKRISSENKDEHFMGTDFTYDDLGERNLNEDTHELLREEEVDGEKCFVVKNIPKEEDYMYSETVTWVSQDKWIGLKKEFYDEDGEHLKTLTVNEYKTIDGIVTITESEMHNVQKDHKTILELDQVKYNTGISENKFTERQMKIGL